ncbi:hypothetical protein SYNPS1DRAFT_22053 [Syncephalis pseudoplumigaleata]|uniref:Uncharacterized protein n=1 Tax=Syncephalis pseudoplumigaleata TaxID=1712513 RepID=A0A4P9Z2U2_9FUNG|nr:hypothetical protein SYNPS1DRAFT_22053 [Syncephalis pseudoplumigaleata]|eukprot:RKP26111.1 hypothetical protein SYNPS1DRAFT_22053 [Syncephalis pseudoplumigaleata]
MHTPVAVKAVEGKEVVEGFERLGDNTAVLAAPCAYEIEPVGATFLQMLQRRTFGMALEEALLQVAEQEALDDDDANEDMADPDAIASEEDEVTPDLMKLDLSEWKKHDHYAIIGLRKLRCHATETQLRNAYRRRVLKYHPDKKAQSGEQQTKGRSSKEDDHFFKCVQKSYELLSDPVRRRQYDSVDAAYSDDIPEKSDKTDFYALYGPVFEREARFSKILPVPKLGNSESTQDEVERFYAFWYSFDSWRSFEFMDKEDVESAENRDEKRWLERQNREERTKLKREDTARVRRLVDQAFKKDPRIKKFKEAKKQEQEAKKHAKEAAAREAKAAEEQAREAERLAREQAEADEKERLAQQKKQREALKNKLRKGRKAVRTLIKERPFGVAMLRGESASETAIALRDVQLDSIIEKLDVDALMELKARLESDADTALSQQIIEELEALNGQPSKPAAVSTPSSKEAATASTTSTSSKKTAEWSTDEIAILIKAVNKFPGGTRKRWETISEYVAMHSGQGARSNEELIAKSKELQQGANVLQNDAIQKLQFAKKHADTRINDEPSQRYEEDGAAASTETEAAPAAAAAASTEQTATNWTPDEQQKLEAALKKYPASWKGEGDRWDMITAEVAGRTKREVKLRVKFLMEQIKAKKATQ